MFITGIGTAIPPRRYLQAECWAEAEKLEAVNQLSRPSRGLLKKVLLGDNGIEGRYLALDSIADAFQLSPDALHARFAEHAPKLAARAAENALRQACVSAREIDALIISTCTGYLCPGLTSYVAELLGLRPDVFALDLVGQGCGAALPNLRAAESLLKSGAANQVLSVCVEVCSAAFYIDEDPGVLISACLFGDAAAATVCSQQPVSHTRRIAWQGGQSSLDPSARDLLRFEQKGGCLRNILTLQVPAVAADHAAALLQRTLDEADLTQQSITTWIWHAGGRNVLAALQRRLGLEEAAFGWSAMTLRDLGNVSSAFVIHVLQRALAGHAPGGFWWMSSFGAGFSCHGALLRVE